MAPMAGLSAHGAVVPTGGDVVEVTFGGGGASVVVVGAVVVVVGAVVVVVVVVGSQSHAGAGIAGFEGHATKPHGGVPSLRDEIRKFRGWLKL